MTRLLPPWRTLLPPEHGSWFMLGFPLALGLLLRPSPAGLCLGLAALSFFLGRPPLRRVLSGRQDPAQLRALLLSGGLALAFGAVALLLSGPRFLLPLACVAPLVVLALRADLQRAVRSLAVELIAQGAFAGLAATMLVAGGGTLVEAGQAWLLITLVGGANLAHVRRILGHAHGLDASGLGGRMIAVHVLHALLLGVSALLLAPRGTAGGIWTGWAVLLYLRALLPYRPIPARTLGWREGGLSVLGLLLLWRALI
ncbi:MAG: YwiC-like family protein [Geothrix sp.]|nr:YwiC-like family protein [Geothrix sp.]